MQAIKPRSTPTLFITIVIL